MCVCFSTHSHCVGCAACWWRLTSAGLFRDHVPDGGDVCRQQACSETMCRMEGMFAVSRPVQRPCAGWRGCLPSAGLFRDHVQDGGDVCRQQACSETMCRPGVWQIAFSSSHLQQCSNCSSNSSCRSSDGCSGCVTVLAIA